jgi:hypothetical protein
MRKVAIAFTGAALCCRGTGRFADIHGGKTPDTDGAVDRSDPCRSSRRRRSGSEKSVNLLNRGTDGPTPPGDAHEFCRATTSFSMGYFTTLCRKFRKHFS